jgi:hypothetical protein
LWDVGIFGIIDVISLQEISPEVWHILLEMPCMNVIFASIRSFSPRDRVTGS